MIPKWLTDRLRTKRTKRFTLSDQRHAEQQERLREAVRKLTQGPILPKKETEQ